MSTVDRPEDRLHFGGPALPFPPSAMLGLSSKPRVERVTEIGDEISRKHLQARRDELLRQAELLEIQGTAIDELRPSEVEKAREALRDGIVASMKAADAAETEKEKERYRENTHQEEDALASINPSPGEAGLAAAERHRLEANQIARQLAQPDKTRNTNF